MANVLNRATKEFLRSVHEPTYPVQDWIINPDLSAVVGYASKYWVITGDTVTLMSQVDRDAVDAAELSSGRDAKAAELEQIESILRAFMRVVLDEVNAHAAKMNEIITATGISVTPYPARTAAQLITAIRNKLGS